MFESLSKQAKPTRLDHICVIFLIALVLVLSCMNAYLINYHDDKITELEQKIEMCSAEHHEIIKSKIPVN